MLLLHVLSGLEGGRALQETGAFYVSRAGGRLLWQWHAHLGTLLPEAPADLHGLSLKFLPQLQAALFFLSLKIKTRAAIFEVLLLFQVSNSFIFDSQGLGKLPEPFL